jgi:hypothetical protein
MGILPTCIKTPANRSPKVPADSEPYKVRDGDGWISIAQAKGIDTWTLIRFNYPTLPSSNSQAALEVNWYLQNYVGCRKLTADNKNFVFSSADAPGLIYLPKKQEEPKPDKKTPAQIVLNLWRYDITLAYMFKEMYDNSRSAKVIAIRAGNSGVGGIGGKGAAYAAWAYLVKSGGDWDHKPKLYRKLSLTKTDKHFPFRGDTQHEYFYDIWSNVHYGYVGRAAGFSEFELQQAHQLGGITGATDPFDIETVQLGLDLWRTYGSSMSMANLEQELLARSPKLQQIQASAAYKAANPNFQHIIPILDGQ